LAAEQVNIAGSSNWSIGNQSGSILPYVLFESGGKKTASRADINIVCTGRAVRPKREKQKRKWKEKKRENNRGATVKISPERRTSPGRV